MATRYIGLRGDILAEVRIADVQVIEWEVKPRKNVESDMDEPLVWAARE